MQKATNENVDTVDRPEPGDQAEDVNPFPGPKAYQKEDTKYFFGRGDEIEELASLVLSTSAVLLFGQSGAGKSSLLEAGLIPYLERRFKVGVLPTVHLGKSALTDDKGGNRFVRTVCEAIAKPGRASSVTRIDEIGALAEAYQTSKSQRVLLILDQFEEIFNRPVSWLERVNFFKTLARTLKERPWLRAVVSLRSDYLAEIVPYERYLPDNFAVRYQIERLYEAQAAGAVESAFAETHVTLPPQDLQTLLDQLLEQPAVDGRGVFRSPDVNTIQLQIVCRRLWEELRRRPSGASEPIFQNDAKFTVQESMTRFVDEALQTVISDTGSDEATVRVWLRDRLITDSGTRAFVLVEGQRTAGLPFEAVRSLVDAKLLQFEHRHGSQLVELTHDSMIGAIRESNERWIRRKDRIRKLRAVLLLILLAVIIAPLPYLRVPPLAKPASGKMSAGVVRIPFGGGEGAAAIDITASGPANGKLSATVSRTDVGGSNSVLERQLVTLGPSVEHGGGGDASGSTAFGVPIEPMGSYVLTLSTDNRDILYQVTIAEIPLLSGNEDLSNISTPRFAVRLQAGTVTQLEMHGDLTSVQGAQVLASDFGQDWAIVRRPSDGLAILNLESTVGPGTPGVLIPTRLSAPTKIAINDKRDFKIDSAAVVQFAGNAPNSLLAAEAVCSKPVDLTLVDGGQGRSSPQLVTSASTILPLRLDKGTRELVLSSNVANTCTLSVREVGKQPITEVKSQNVGMGPGELSAAYPLQFSKDVIIMMKQADGITASVVCGTSVTTPNANRLVAYLPANSPCTLWIIRAGSAVSGQPTTQRLQLTGEGV